MARNCKYCGREVHALVGEYILPNNQYACGECWKEHYDEIQRDIRNSEPGISNYSSHEETEYKRDYGNSKKGPGCFCVAAIIIGLLLMSSGVGAVAGIPIAGIGGLGYLIYKAGIVEAAYGSKGSGCAALVICGIVVLIIILLVISGN